ncbi:PH, RCC1 and FYVE domains-containing protein 1-like isoform X1 [Typha latifolia]|uniref:PH, RCC1 and FYVE domains-containing protein 1-like isoform X1 n=2 Tax=Typha latifolia TaxID=4733 RepID=UPI003C2B7A12
MADPIDIEKALIALKKGAQLLKYGRKGKPKFYPFRLSNDESLLVWVSSSKEKILKLASVSRIISGQRTLVFQRYLLPDKDHLSFSLIYNNGKRSLDLICKDKVEAEVWFTGLNSLISSSQHGFPKLDGWSDGGLSVDSGRERSISSNSTVTVDSLDNKIRSSTSTEKQSFEDFEYSERTNVIDMQLKGSSSDIRISVSSAPSTSSHGSGQEDYESFGDVYVWGEVICDSSSTAGADRNFSFPSGRTGILIPKPLESNVMLDVSYVSCGVRHAAIITRQAEIFTWGEECGGRLGHGVGSDVIHPHLIESLSSCNIELVACGEFHTCAVTATGDLYTWGDGTYNAGLLGHGTKVSHWIPKRVSGPLEGLQVCSVSCGTWHTALITTNGQLYTFGDGTFGVLGHGNRESVLCPKEVESLKGLKTIAVSCGVWHTAAVVDVIVTQSSGSYGKLFTWGDGDKHRLGHGDRAPMLKPTCVPSLIDHNFQNIACGHSLTIGLTTSGHVFTMGSTVYGQLGNPHSDGKFPCLVIDKLGSESVAEVACGSYHVAVLTTAGEVYTWGKGANGRLGHGDLEDRKTPTLVEALKDRTVKHIACGSSFTAAICHHKWVSGAEQSQCSACRQAFGFTRKRHNCYNCGLVHCHSCSSRKALRAALSPNPGKPYRVCDSCYLKLNKVLESGTISNKKNVMPRISGESKDRPEKVDMKASKVTPSSSLDLIKNLDVKAAKLAKKSDSSSQVPSLLQLKDIPFVGGVDLHQMSSILVHTSAVPFANDPRAISPFSRKSSPPRATIPNPVMSDLSSLESIDSLKETNKILNQEVQRLHSEVDSLRQCNEKQEIELQISEKKAQEAMALAAEESAKSKAAKEVIKSLTAQLKEMAERLPHGNHETKHIGSVHIPNGFAQHGIVHPDSIRDNQSRYEPSSVPLTAVPSFRFDGIFGRNHLPRNLGGDNTASSGLQDPRIDNNNSIEGHYNIQQNVNGLTSLSGTRSEDFDRRETERFQINLNVSNTRSPTAAGNQVEAEWIEQYEPGVYLTLIALHDGTKELKRVRFSRRRFGEQQAETWWSDNREKVYEKYNVSASDRISSVIST